MTIRVTRMILMIMRMSDVERDNDNDNEQDTYCDIEYNIGSTGESGSESTRERGRE